MLLLLAAAIVLLGLGTVFRIFLVAGMLFILAWVLFFGALLLLGPDGPFSDRVPVAPAATYVAPIPDRMTSPLRPSGAPGYGPGSMPTPPANLNCDHPRNARESAWCTD
jgi:hypothetical protein